MTCYISGLLALVIRQGLALGIGDEDLHDGHMPVLHRKVERSLAARLVRHIEVVVQQIVVEGGAHLAAALLADIQLGELPVGDDLQQQLGHPGLVHLGADVHRIVAAALLEAGGRVAAADQEAWVLPHDPLHAVQVPGFDLFPELH